MRPLTGLPVWAVSKVGRRSPRLRLMHLLRAKQRRLISVPDWLVELPISTSSPLQAEALPDWMLEDQDQATSDGLEPADKSSEWLFGENLIADAGSAIAGSAILEGVTNTSDGDTASAEPSAGSDLDWLAELEAAYASSSPMDVMPVGEAQDEQDFGLESPGQGAVIGGELPGWMDEAPAHTGESGDQPQPGEELTPASLPSWLEAMRPVAAVGLAVGESGSDAGLAERAGPLQGVHGVIPAEPDVYHVRKPPVYAAKLQISDAQRSHADLLARLVAAEARASGWPRQTTHLTAPPSTPGHLPGIGADDPLAHDIGFPPVGAPPYRPQVSTLSQLVGSLPANSPVLVAVDYEPAYSGELDAVAASILDHLMIKGAYFTSFLPCLPVRLKQST